MAQTGFYPKSHLSKIFYFTLLKIKFLTQQTFSGPSGLAHCFTDLVQYFIQKFWAESQNWMQNSIYKNGQFCQLAVSQPKKPELIRKQPDNGQNLLKKILSTERLIKIKRLMASKICRRLVGAIYSSFDLFPDSVFFSFAIIPDIFHHSLQCRSK